jgi:thiol-disulfide isomerase/thioredoxin
MAKAKTRKVNAKAKAKVVKIQTNKDIPKFNKATGLVLVVVTASWCGACKRIQPELMKSLNTPTKNTRLLIDSEVAKNIPALNNAVTKYPSFIVLKNGSPMDQAGPEGITKEIQETPRTASEMIELANNPPNAQTQVQAQNANANANANAQAQATMTPVRRNTRRANQSNVKNATPVNLTPISPMQRSLTYEPMSLEQPKKVIMDKNSPTYVAK